MLGPPTPPLPGAAEAGGRMRVAAPSRLLSGPVKKAKFVDVLGNIKKDQNGLSGLDGLNNHPGARNMESAS